MKFFALLIIFAFGFSFGSSVFAETSVTSYTNNIFKCELLYNVYKKVGEEQFVQKYYKSTTKECVKLYKDPNWTFAGKEKIDRQTQIAKEIKKLSVKIPKIVMAKPTQIGDNKYSVHFGVCSDTRISDPSFLIDTRIEEFIIMSVQPINKNTCKMFNVEVNAKSPQNIRVNFVPSIDDPIFKGSKIVVYGK